MAFRFDHNRKGLVRYGLLAVIAGLPLTAGCPSTLPCRDGTLFVEVELGEQAAGADTLVVTVALAGQPPRTARFELLPGATRGSVEVEFPQGYPGGMFAEMTVSARAGDVVLAERRTGEDLGEGCHVLRTALVSAAVADGGDRGDAGGFPMPDGGVRGDGGPVADTRAPCRQVPEECFNDEDDDCDGKIDCEDSDCEPTASCVSGDPAAQGRPGAVVPWTVPCPQGYSEQESYFVGRDLVAPAVDQCLGCRCETSSTASCTTEVTYFLGASPTCGAGTPVFRFQARDGDGSEQMCVVPQLNPVYGVAVSDWTPHSFAQCRVSGTPQPVPARFESRYKFCPAERRGGGCEAGAYCVPRAAIRDVDACVAYDGPALAQVSCLEWYRTVDDRRTCGPCNCDITVTDQCRWLSVVVKRDYSCGSSPDIVLSGGMRHCLPQGATPLYAPGLRVEGLPLPPRCVARSALVGSHVAPADPVRLCCR